MNDNDPYQSWLEKRRNPAFSDDFSKKVVDQILRNEQARRRPLPDPKWEIDRWLEWISLRPWMQTAMIAGALVAGVLRWILILQIVFPF
jgi:hypothetical protein